VYDGVVFATSPVTLLLAEATVQVYMAFDTPLVTVGVYEIAVPEGVEVVALATTGGERIDMVYPSVTVVAPVEVN